MAKRKLYHLHKIKIHHNRWLIWALAYALIVALALISYIKISDLNISSEADSVFSSFHSYSDSRLGFGVRYPADWAIEAEASSVTFLPPELSDSGVTVTVADPSSSVGIRKNLKIISETNTTLGGIIATRLVNDLGGGHSEIIIMATHNKKLYVVNGTENLMRPVLLTFHFITK